MESTTVLPRTSTSTPESGISKILSSQPTKTVIVALSAIALLAALVFIEVKYRAVSTVLTLAILNPVTSFVISLLAIGTVIYILIRMCRKPLEKTDISTHAHSPTQSESASSTAQSPTSAQSETVNPTHSTQPIGSSYTTTTIETSHFGDENRSITLIRTQERAITPSEETLEGEPIQVEDQDHLNLNSRTSERSSFVNTQYPLPAQKEAVIAAVSSLLTGQDEVHLIFPNMSAELFTEQVVLEDSHTSTSFLDMLEVQEDSGKVVGAAIETEPSASISALNDIKSPKKFIFSNPSAEMLILANKQLEEFTKKCGFANVPELMRVNDLFAHFNRKYEGRCITDIGFERFYLELSSLKNSLAGVFPNDPQAFENKFSSIDEPKWRSYNLAFNLYPDVLLKVLSYVKWLNENDPEGQLEPKNADSRKELLEATRSQIRATTKNQSVLNEKKPEKTEEKRAESTQEQPFTFPAYSSAAIQFKAMEFPPSPILPPVRNDSLTPIVTSGNSSSSPSFLAVPQYDLSADCVQIDYIPIGQSSLSQLKVVFIAQSYEFYLLVDEFIFQNGEKLSQEKIDENIDLIAKHCWNFQGLYDDFPPLYELIQVNQEDVLASIEYKDALYQSMAAEDLMREFILDLHQIIPEDPPELAKRFDKTQRVDSPQYHITRSYMHIHELYRSFLTLKIINLRALLKDDPHALKCPMLSGRREDDLKWCQERLAITKENYETIIRPKEGFYTPIVLDDIREAEAKARKEAEEKKAQPKTNE